MRSRGYAWIGFLLVAVLATGPARAQAPRAYVTNFASDSVSVIDTAGDSVIATIAVGSAPLGVAVAHATGRVYVANFGSDSVSVIDAGSNAVLDTIPVGSAPHGVAVDSAGGRIYVANSGGTTVSVIDGVAGSVVRTIDLEGAGQPLGLALLADDSKIYVSRAGDASGVAVLDATGFPLGQIAVEGNPKGLALSPDAARLYVARASAQSEQSVTVIDTATDVEIPPALPAGAASQAAVVHPSGNPLYVTSFATGTLAVIDLVTGARLASVPIGLGGVFGVGVTPDGSKVYVADNAAGSSQVYVVDTASNTVVGSITVGSRPVAFGDFISHGGAVDVFDLLDRLADLVASLGLPHGTERSLTAKLEAAAMVLGDVAPENDHAAANILEAFIRQVRAQQGKAIAEPEAAALIDAVQAILDALGDAVGSPLRGMTVPSTLFRAAPRGRP